TKRSRSSMMPVSLQTIAGPPGCQRTVTYVNGPFCYLSIRVGHLPGISPTGGEITSGLAFLLNYRFVVLQR
ncbi:hypothetical protein, partial [Rhizobium leguminosarum]|uniref:hypothetical protein n=1 Tax=Rhizobium leguminosarum TaxID=384 RepID=UPI001C95E925